MLRIVVNAPLTEEEALQEANVMIEAMRERVPNAVIDLNEWDWNFIEVNVHTEGFSAKEITAMVISSFSDNVIDPMISYSSLVG
jgi:hypothetical protein